MEQSFAGKMQDPFTAVASRLYGELAGWSIRMGEGAEPPRQRLGRCVLVRLPVKVYAAVMLAQLASCVESLPSLGDSHGAGTAAHLRAHGNSTATRAMMAVQVSLSQACVPK